MQALTRAASLLRPAAGSAPTTAGLHHPPRGVGPCLAKALSSHLIAGEKKSSQTVHGETDDEKLKIEEAQNETFVSVEEHERAIRFLKQDQEKAISNLSSKIDESILEHKNYLNETMMNFRSELEKVEREKNKKHGIDYVNIRKDFKSLEDDFKAHEIEVKDGIAQKQLKRLKVMTLGGGMCSSCDLYCVGDVFSEVIVYVYLSCS